MKDKSLVYARNTLYAGCLMLGMWVGLWWNCITLYAESLIKEWGIMRTQFMLVATIMALTNAVMQLLFYGKIAARLGTRKYILLSGVVCTLGIILIASSRGLVTFYLGAFIFGTMVAGVTNNPVTEIISSWYKKNVGKLIGITQTVSSAAGIIFSLIVATVIRSFGWRIPVWITAIAGAVSTLFVMMLYKGSPEDVGAMAIYADEAESESDGEEDGIPYSNIFKTAQFYLLLVGYILVPMVAQAALSNLPLLSADLGYGDLSGTFLSVALVASAAFFIPAGQIIDKYGTKWMVTISILCLVTAFVLLLFAKISLVLTYVVAALIGVASDACQLPFGISVKEAFGTKDYSKKLGIISAFVFLALAFGPSIMTVFYDVQGNYDFAMVLFIVLGIIGTIAIHFGTKRVGEN